LGSIEIVTSGQYAPYTILFDNGITGVINDGESSYVFENFCSGLYSLSISDDNPNNICEKRIENIEVLNTGLSQSDCTNVDVDLKVFLEGPYDLSLGEMKNPLNQKGLLPGQDPISSLNAPTPSPLPYTEAPWNYDDNMSSITSEEIYQAGIVDWILVGYRTVALKTESTVL